MIHPGTSGNQSQYQDPRAGQTTTSMYPYPYGHPTHPSLMPQLNPSMRR
jgi:hypothetical protein